MKIEKYEQKWQYLRPDINSEEFSFATALLSIVSGTKTEADKWNLKIMGRFQMTILQMLWWYFKTK